MKTTVEIADQTFEVEYDFKITSPGCGQTWEQPAEAAEFELAILSIALPNQAADVVLELPEWLKDVIAQYLYESDDVNTAVQEAAEEPDYD